MIVTPTLVAELTDVLGREKFSAHAAEGRAAAFVAALLDRAEMVPDVVPSPSRTADPDDDYLLAIAEARAADAVVSGDRHVLEATSSQLPVVTPRELSDRLGLAQ